MVTLVLPGEYRQIPARSGPLRTLQVRVPARSAHPQNRQSLGLAAHSRHAVAPGQDRPASSVAIAVSASAGAGSLLGSSGTRGSYPLGWGLARPPARQFPRRTHYLIRGCAPLAVPANLTQGHQQQRRMIMKALVHNGPRNEGGTDMEPGRINTASGHCRNRERGLTNYCSARKA
jgi:hypothetical protein